MYKTTNDRFYNSKRWRQHAAAILSAAGYVDEVQKRYGRMIPADVVHHILPLQLYPEYAYSNFNLIAINKKTHDSLHQRDGTLTRAGMDLARQVARREKIDISALEYQESKNNLTSGKRYATKNAPRVP